MYRHITISLLSVLVLAGCYPTRIVTVAPYNTAMQSYSTTVTIPRSKLVTTTTNVTAVSNDISLYLDLQAVGAAFAQSSNIQEFEALLNNSSYIISNLDLNGDGYVDYLRVVEQMQGYNHIYLIQAVLGANIYQDVATVVAEVPSLASYHVQVIGAPYIYGPNYYIDPIFISRPPIIAHICRHSYRPWMSPWDWGHFPSYYRRPAPLHPQHYHAYVNTYMHHHHYCHGFNYADHCHFAGYSSVAHPMMRGDFERMHPEKTFSNRTANIPEVNRISGANARNITEHYNSSMRTSTTSTARSAASRQSSSAAPSSSTASRTPSASASSSTASRTPSTSASSSSTASRTPSTSASSSSTASRTPSASTSSSSTASRTPSTSASSSSTASRTPSASTSSSTASRTPSTTVQSRVSNSGSTNTKISTVTANGTSSTVSRNSSSSSRSSSSASSSRSSSSSSPARTSSSSSSSRSSSPSSSSSSSRSSSPSSSSSRTSSSSSRSSR